MHTCRVELPQHLTPNQTHHPRRQEVTGHAGQGVIHVKMRGILMTTRRLGDASTTRSSRCTGHNDLVDKQVSGRFTVFQVAFQVIFGKRN